VLMFYSNTVAMTGAEELQSVGRELPPGVKAALTPDDMVRDPRAFTVRLAQLQSASGAPPRVRIVAKARRRRRCRAAAATPPAVLGLSSSWSASGKSPWGSGAGTSRGRRRGRRPGR